jgi:general secretion pathway protein D
MIATHGNHCNFVLAGCRFFTLTHLDGSATVLPLAVAARGRMRASDFIPVVSQGSDKVNRNGILAPICIVICALFLGDLASPARSQPASSGEYRVYRIQHKHAADVERILSELLPPGAGFHLVCDKKSNSLLLRAAPELQDVARNLIQQADRPTRMADRSGQSQTVADDRPVVRAYSVPRSQMQSQERAIREFCEGRTSVRVTTSPETEQIFVLAPLVVHGQIDNLLAKVDSSLTQRHGSSGQAGHTTRPRGLPATGHDRSSTAGMLTNKTLQIRSAPIEQIERQLFGLFGQRLQRRPQREGDIHVLPLESGTVLQFQFDVPRRRVLVRGTVEAVDQFASLVAALDSAGQTGIQTKALRIERSAPGQVRQTVEAIQGDLPSRAKLGVPDDDDQSSAATERRQGPVRLVNYLFQEDSGDGGGAAGSNNGGVTRPPSLPSGPGLEDLEIQMLPDLDVIIVQGRDQDVEQFERIIRELERLSAETRPKIQIYWLKHTLGESVKEIVDEVQVDLVGGRQGRVSVTVLGKPNALLLIGWGEAVESVTELISKLDRPVAPESQFSVFALKYASAAVVDSTIAEFFSGRDGMGPTVQTAVDSRTNSLIVYAAPRDMLEVQRLIENMDVSESHAVSRVEIFPLENSLAVDVAQTLQQAITAASSGQAGRSAMLELLTVDEDGQQMLQSGMLDNINITPDSRNNNLIVTGPKQAMELVAAFIRYFDQPGERAYLKIFRVINGDATNLIQMLRSLIPSQVGQALGPQLSTAPEESSIVPLRFSVEVRSNSIIAVGSEGDLRLVEALLTRLDESESMNRRNAVYMLKNAPAVEVAQTVNEFLQSQRTLEAAEPGQSNPFQDLEREVIVVPEPVGNRLVVSATPRYFDEITQLIEKLDEPPPQVMIQVLIAEVTLNDLDELGVELGLQDSVLFDRSLLENLEKITRTTSVSDPNGIITTTTEEIIAASNTPGFSFNDKEIGNSGSEDSLGTAANVGGQALSNFALGRVSSNLDFGGLVLSASSQNLSVLIRALQETRQIRILSRPTIRTLDNQPAFIQVGQRVPRIVGSTTNQIGQSNTVELENVGLILGVTPRISPEGNVVMEIDAEKSKVGPEDEGIPISVSVDGTIVRSPRVDTITAQATVSAADRETVVLGGMIETQSEIVTRRAPYLAEIPILGQLFRYDSNQEQRMELLIILTPHVIRDAEDSEKIKQAEFARMNWCAADVYDIYGDAGIRFQSDVALPIDDSCTTEVIYPDSNPHGATELPSTEQPGFHELPPLGDPTMTVPAQPEPARNPNLMPPRPVEPRPSQPPTGGEQESNAWPLNPPVRPNPETSSRPVRQPTENAQMRWDINR